MPRWLRLSFVFMSLTVFIVVVVHIFRVVRIDRLYREALVPNSAKASPIDELARIDDRRATAALLRIARLDPPRGEAQDAAIRALGIRNDPQVGTEIAQMLRLDQGLSTRRAITESLQRLPCDEVCVERIIHYLARRWSGERTPEENISEPERWRAENAAIEDKLRSILANHVSETEQVLADRYDISTGSLTPSPFGIELVERLELRAECPPIRKSRQELEKLYSTNGELIRQLLDAEKTLGCQ